jgi:hypothetical protein
MAVLVLQAVVRQSIGYWILAIGLHAATNAAAVGTVGAGWHPLATEGIIGLFASLALGIILVYRDGARAEGTATAFPVEPPLPPLPTGALRPHTAEERLRQQIERSKWE